MDEENSMRKKHVANRNGYCCYIACIEAILDANGLSRRQEDIVADNPSLCQVVRDQVGAILKGVIPHGKEQELCAKENIDLKEMGSVTSTSCLRTMLVDGNDYIIGVSHGKDGMHAVLFDSFDGEGKIVVMDPDRGHTVLDTDYANVNEFVVYRTTYSGHKKVKN